MRGPPSSFIPSACEFIEFLRLLGRENLPNPVTCLFADSIELGVRLLLRASKLGRRALDDSLDLRNLRLGKIELGFQALNEVLTVKRTVPVACVPSIIEKAGAPYDHAKQECEGKIEVDSAVH